MLSLAHCDLMTPNADALRLSPSCDEIGRKSSARSRGERLPLLGNASEATETDKSGEFENRRYLPAFVELMKASGHMFDVAFRQHISKKVTSCSSRHHASIFDATDQCHRVGKRIVEEATE